MSDEKLDEILRLLRAIQTQQSAPPRVWLTPAEAAVYLGVSVTRVYQYIRDGRIPYHRLPDSSLLRLHTDQLDEWVRSGTEKAREESLELIKRLMK